MKPVGVPIGEAFHAILADDVHAPVQELQKALVADAHAKGAVIGPIALFDGKAAKPAVF